MFGGGFAVTRIPGAALFGGSSPCPVLGRNRKRQMRNVQPSLQSLVPSAQIPWVWNEASGQSWVAPGWPGRSRCGFLRFPWLCRGPRAALPWRGGHSCCSLVRFGLGLPSPSPPALRPSQPPSSRGARLDIPQTASSAAARVFSSRTSGWGGQSKVTPLRTGRCLLSGARAEQRL